MENQSYNTLVNQGIKAGSRRRHHAIPTLGLFCFFKLFPHAEWGIHPIVFRIRQGDASIKF